MEVPVCSATCLWPSNAEEPEVLEWPVLLPGDPQPVPGHRGAALPGWSKLPKPWNLGREQLMLEHSVVTPENVFLRSHLGTTDTGIKRINPSIVQHTEHNHATNADTTFLFLH